MTTTLFTWDGMNAMTVNERLALPKIHMYAEVGSTLDVAHEMAEQGAPAGTLIVADAQRAGRGRLGRSWSSQPGRGVWSTIIERPSDTRALDVLSLRVGLHCAEACDALARQTVGVKWPNDLVLQSKKLGGILVEARWAGSSIAWVAIGVGVNVTAPDHVNTATGMPRGVQRIDVLAAIVSSVRSAAQERGHLTPDELRRYADRHTLTGKRIVSPAVGTVEGVSADGSLIVRTARGVEQLRTGTVQFEGEHA